MGFGVARSTIKGKTITSEELTEWVNQHYAGFQPPAETPVACPKPPSFVPRLQAARKACMPLSKPSPTVTVHPSGRNKKERRHRSCLQKWEKDHSSARTVARPLKPSTPRVASGQASTCRTALSAGVGIRRRQLL